MKLEIRYNFDGDLAEARGEVSSTNPLLGILIGEVGGNMNVLNVVAGKTKLQIVRAMGLKTTDVEIVDLR
jgi:hypothetical protein